jgi:hypothetical protein
MSKRIQHLILLYLVSAALLCAFEQDAIWKRRLNGRDEAFRDPYELTGNPAAKVYKGNIQSYSISSRLGNYGYRRLYDPDSDRNITADFTALMQINEGAFFQAGINYNDHRQKRLFASMEKDFYNDYFSMIDSTTGDVAYYGPQLFVMYNTRLAGNLYLGIMGNYGIERSLKDTFPQTITIMRNSAYRAGLEYRGDAAAIGVLVHYYDNQKHYEAVKEYSEVEPRTYFGYNVFYNELAGSKSEKLRKRKGLEYGLHFRLGRTKRNSLQAGISGFKGVSKADLIRGSHTRERGIWQREGLHAFAQYHIRPGDLHSLQFYGDYLRYNDWGASQISNTLVLENEERFLTLGLLFDYRPSLAQQIHTGAEIRHVAYDYTEFIFPFHDERGGREWEVRAGGRAYVSAKDRLSLDFRYGTEIPRFYWETEGFTNLTTRISLAHLFSFGYINVDVEYINKTPENNLKRISVYEIGLSYYRK